MWCSNRRKSLLTHEILKPLPKYGGHIYAFGAPAQQQQFPVAVRSGRGEGTVVGGKGDNGRIWHPRQEGQTGPEKMDKLAYAKWVEGPSVKQRFKVGKLVTLASSPIVLNQAPQVVFLIDHIAEIHIQVIYDIDTKEPRCIGIKPKMAAGVVMYPPAKLRPLTEEEEQLVHLRDSQAIAPKTEQGGTPSPVGGASPSEEGGSSRQARTGDQTGTESPVVLDQPENDRYSG